MWAMPFPMLGGGHTLPDCLGVCGTAVPVPPCQSAAAKSTFYHAAKRIFPAELVPFLPLLMHIAVCVPLRQYLLRFLKNFLADYRFVMVTDIKLIFLPEIFQPPF